MTCTYRFVGANGKQTVITGQAAFKAFLADGGLEQLLGAKDTNSPFKISFSTRQQPPSTWPLVEEPKGPQAKAGESITVLRLASMEGLDNVNAASVQGLYTYLSMVDDSETNAGSEAAGSNTIYAYKVQVPEGGFGEYSMMRGGKAKLDEKITKAGREDAKYGGYWYSFPEGTEAELLGSISLDVARDAALKVELARREFPLSERELERYKGNFDRIGTVAGTEALLNALGLQFSTRQANVLARVPELESAAQGVKEGTVTKDQYDKLVNKLKPVTPYAEVPAPATQADMERGLTSDKVERIGIPSETLKAGDPVGIRLDIPAYSNHGVWVVSVHEQEAGYAAGKSIGYESVAAVTNPTFGVVEKAALAIAGGKPKATIAVMKGDWKPITPKQASTTAKMAMKGDNWVQVGMDPTRHAYFYDRDSMEPVVSADEAVQIGPLVLAKNPVYGKKSDFAFSKRQEIRDAADAIAKMDPDVRDNTYLGDFPGAATGYMLYEARQMLKKPTEKLKRINENNSFALWQQFDYIANVDGEYFGVAKQEDPDEPDDESQFVYSFEPLDTSNDGATTGTSDTAELFKEMRASLGNAPAFSKQQDIGAALEDRVDNDFDALVKEYNRIDGTDGGKVLDTDIARELSPEYRADRSRAGEVHEAVSKFIDKLYQERIENTSPDGVVVFMAGGGGAGKSSAGELISDVFEMADIIYDGTLSTYNKAERRIQSALDAGQDVYISYIYREPIDALRNGVLSRAMNTGRTVPLDGLVKGHAGSSETVNRLQEKFGNDPAFKIYAIDNSRGFGKAELVPLTSIPRVNIEGLKEEFENATNEEYEAGRISEAVYRATVGESVAATQADRKQNEESVRRGRESGRERNAVSFSNRNIFNQPAPLANWTAPLQTKADTLIYALQNKLIDTKRVIEAINQTGKQIDEDWNVYLQEELFHGRTAKQTTDFLQTELRPLVEDMQKRGVDLPDFEEYLHNRHAEERNKQIAKVNPNMQDGGSGIDTADAQAYLAGLTADQKRDYSALAARIDAINQNTRDLLVNSGLESQETIDKWEKTYSDYVPLFRDDVDFSTQGPAGMRTGQGYSVKGGASRRAMGSKKAVIDILANIAMQRERTIVRAEKNRVALSLYGLAVQNPNTDFWLAIDPAGQKNPNRAMADLMTIGVNPVDAQNIIKEPKQRYVDQNTGLVAERINPAIRSNPMVLAARIDGVEKYVFFNANDERSQRMVSALKNLDADQLGYITANFIAPVTRWFAQVNTQFNPIFGAINFIRDSKGAMFNLSTTAIAGKQAAVAKGLFPAMKGIYQGARAQRKGGPPAAGSYAQLWDEFQEVGGQTGYRDQFINSEDRAKALQRMLDPASWASSPLGKVFTANGTLKVPMEVARKTAAPLFDWLSDYNETMENAVRLSAYKVALDNGLSKQEAASIAKNLTVNFNRKGQIATQAGAWYAFFNASIQSNARLIETLRGPLGKKIITGGLMIGTAQALLLAAAGFDDDEPPDFIKERNLVIPIGLTRKYLTIPMPLGFNVIPNTSRVMTEWALSGFKDTPKRVGQITGALLETFNPIGNSGWSVQTIAPTIVDPLVALAENRDFTGKNIAKKDRSELAPTPGYTRTKDTASFLAKQMSYFLNLASGGTDFKPGLFSPTPDQIDYLIGQATGGVGREVLKVEQSVTGALKKEEVAPNKIPILGRFYGDANATANISGKYYDNLTMLNKHEAEIEGRKKRGEKLDEYYKDNPEARLYKKANDVESDVARLRKRLKTLKERKASDETIKLVNTQITAKMKRLNAMVKDAED